MWGGSEPDDLRTEADRMVVLIARLMKQSDFDGHGIGRAAGGGHFAASLRSGRSQAESPVVTG